jgi:pimeloyl-ACP methyl ester carboxylesterase
MTTTLVRTDPFRALEPADRECRSELHSPPAGQFTNGDGATPTVQRHLIDLHGRPMSYLQAGGERSDRVLVLLHGLGGNANTWEPLLGLLGRHARVLAPDLLGHGQSAAPRGADYSIGAHACRLRDLLQRLGISRAHVVGHSFGAGVAMSFAYQFPERTESLTLIGSGGFGPELSVLLRAASLPGVVAALGACAGIAPRPLARLAGWAMVAAGVVGAAELETLGRVVGALSAAERRRALVATLREVADWSGQRIDATDRLYLFADLPMLLVVGRGDSWIPYEHTLRAHQLLPQARLCVLDAGHFPHTEHPAQVAALIAEHIAAAGAGPAPAGRRTRSAASGRRTSSAAPRLPQTSPSPPESSPADTFAAHEADPALPPDTAQSPPAHHGQPGNPLWVLLNQLPAAITSLTWGVWRTGPWSKEPRDTA